MDIIAINENGLCVKSVEIAPPVKGHRLSVQLTAFAKSGHIFASGSWDGSVRLFDQKYNEIRSFYLDEPIEGLQLAGNYVAYGSESHFHLFEFESDRQVPIGDLTNQALRGGVFAFSPSADLLAIATFENALLMWSPSSG
ncbi:MAG TPA: WD40 repeat domain-containing protein, partial [Candidatus Hodarchaeales archaeon]|nr:WD40 repeat domain-containing protein [Candidatus Hodarchaeales archaeon]